MTIDVDTLLAQLSLRTYRGVIINRDTRRAVTAVGAYFTGGVDYLNAEGPDTLSALTALVAAADREELARCSAEPPHLVLLRPHGTEVEVAS